VSSIVTDQGLVHYEAYGSGPAVILLHGWLGSWALWQPTMEALGQKYRCYALDFWGFGESGKKRSSYAVTDFIALVPQFMDALGIIAAPLIGHSMGGTTSLGTTIRYPDRVRKVAVIGSPIVGSSLSVLLKISGSPFLRWGVRGKLEPLVRWLLMRGLKLYAPVVTRAPEKWWPLLEKDVSSMTVASFVTSIGSLHHTDLRPELHTIKVPALGIYGKRDVLVHPKQHELLKAGVPHARIEVRDNSGHFTMLDEPDAYLDIIKSFLAS
jgi:pimeloyl-ACP methyl ester carboxylesterase